MRKDWQHPFLLDIPAMEELAEKHSSSYENASPFKHVVIDDFLPADLATSLFEHFPPVDSGIWMDQKTVRQPKKLGIVHASRLKGLASPINDAICQFNSFPFLNFLTKLTGIGKLLPDPYLHGGGLQQVMNGGWLDVHADFTHLGTLDLFRRINILYYLNPGWKQDYGGYLEFWDPSQASSECVKSIAPIFNRLVVFSTTNRTYHGHPNPLSLPPGITRKAIALYFYTAQPDPEEEYTGHTGWLFER